MDRKIREAFGEVRAGEDLKESTLAYLARKTGGFQGKKPRPLARRLAAAACSLLVVAGVGLLGGWVYYTPTAAIQIGVTPPVQLAVNRFGRVIGAGDSTAAQELEHQPYAQAVEALVEQAGQEELSIAVAGEDEGQCREILAQVEDCAGGAACTLASEEEMAAAQEAGLPYGKYRAFLELQALDPSLTPEDVAGMTMREIRAWIDELAAEDAEGTASGQGQGNGQGNGQGKRKGKS